MITESDVEASLQRVFNEKFIGLWWNLTLPGLGYATPRQIFKNDPQLLLSYVESYLKDGV